MTLKQAIKAAEAIIFASGDGMTFSALMEILEVDEKEMQYIVDTLKDKYYADNSGIVLVRNTDIISFTTSKEQSEIVHNALAIKKNSPLSNAAMETLAIIAYNQPVTKAYVEQVRGVDCSGVVSTLVEKGLLEEKGRLELPGRPLLYGTTANFLRCFGLKNLEELPEVPSDDIIEDSNGQLKMLSTEVLELAQKMNEEAEELAEDVATSEDEQ